MEIKVRGYENNRPFLYTYDVSDESIAEAVADNRGWFYEFNSKRRE